MIHNVQQLHMLKMPPPSPTLLKMRFHSFQGVFFRKFEDFVGQFPQQPLQFYVSGLTGFLVYYCRPFPYEIPTERSQVC